MYQPSNNRRLSESIDWKLIVCYLLLMLTGLVNIYASIHGQGDFPIYEPGTRSGKQLMWIGISLLAAILILFVIKPSLWEVLSVPAYVTVIVLLIAVMVFGTTVNGSKSWFHLGPVSFQPSELSKITTSLVLAHFLREINLNRRLSLREAGLLAAVVALPSVVILAEGETGTLLVYIGYLFVLYREGLSGWWIAVLGAVITLFLLTIMTPLWVPFAALALMVGLYAVWTSGHLNSSMARRKNRLVSIVAFAVGAALILSGNYVFENVLKPHQKVRIEVLLGLKDDIRGAGYNVHQSMIAIGSGGAFGKGYLQGTQTSFGFVPEQSTDFIFCTVGEEWGFVGCLFVILLFGYMIKRIINDAEGCREPFTRIYGYCVAACLFMHMIINIGMTIGIMPVIGIPLPFMSYGGSSLLAFTSMLFIFIALVRRERKYF